MASVKVKPAYNNLKDVATISNLKETLISRRRELGLSVRQLGEKAAVSYTVIYDFEVRGIVPKIETLFKIFNSLGLDLHITAEASTSLEKMTTQQLIKEGLLLSGASKTEIDEIMNFIGYTLSRKQAVRSRISQRNHFLS